MEEIGEAILWFSLTTAVSVLGLIAAFVSVSLSHWRGTRSGRAPIILAFMVLSSTVPLWVIFVFVDSPCSMTYAAVNSLATFMSFVYWFNRYDRS